MCYMVVGKLKTFPKNYFEQVFICLDLYLRRTVAPPLFLTKVILP